MSKHIKVTKENIGDILSEGIVMMDFWAEWCGPCRMIGPTIDELAEEYEGKAKVCKVNVDEERELAEKYKIRSIPAIIFFKDGEIVDQMIGAASKDKFKEKIDKLI
jgi:thioredoxin 1